MKKASKNHDAAEQKKGRSESAPRPRFPGAASGPAKPKNLRDVPRYIREVVGGFFSHLFYIIRLVYEAKPSMLFLLAFFCIAGGFMPVIGALITSSLLSAIQVLLQNGIHVSATGFGAVLHELLSGEFRPVFFLLIFQFVFLFLQNILSRVSAMMNSIAGEVVSNHIKLKIMNKAKTVDVASFDRPDFYERLENATREASMRPISIMRATFDVFSTIISSVSFVLVLAGLNILAPIIIVLCAIPTGIVSMHFRNRNFKYMRRSSKERRRMEYFSYIVTDRDGIKENRLMDLSDTFIGEYEKNFDAYYKGVKNIVIREQLAHILLGLIALVANCCLFFYVAYRVVVEGAPIGNYALYTGALTSIAGYVSSFISSAATIYEGTLFIDNMMLFMKEKTTILPTVKPPKMPKKDTEHTIEFRHVFFRYPGSDRDVLHDVSFVLRPEETVVIVGLNGAGKTTLIKLLTRLYDPTAGEILLDGTDIREYDVKALYDLFGIIFQDFGKYAVSVRDNIAYGDVHRKGTDDEIIDAAVRGNADPFIRNLPDGYNTPLSHFFEENGVDLSIGQWQKLSIARAFYKESDIMILDEPTASLDPLAEQEIFNQFAELGRNRITIFVSHRLSSATIASLILVMENGRVIESGTHKELMAYHGRYCQLFSTQAKRYTGDESFDDAPEDYPELRHSGAPRGEEKTPGAPPPPLPPR